MLKEFFKQVLPSMLAFSFSGLYTIVDGFFIGRNIGDLGLAAIGIGFPLAAFIQAVGTGIGMGGAIGISVSHGKDQREEEYKYLGNTLCLLGIAGIILMIVLAAACQPILKVLGADGAVLEAALAYIRVIILGTVFQLCATGFTPLLRNYGGALTAMIAMIAGFVTNIVLDALFVSVFKYGMAGAAWATIIGQAVTVIPCIWFLAGKMKGTGKEIFRLQNQKIINILKIGISPFGLTMSPFIVMMLMNKSAIRYGGEAAVAAYAVIAYVISIIQLLLQGIGDGSQPLISFYMGKGEIKKAIKIRNMAYTFSAFVAMLNVIIIPLLRQFIPQFFGASQIAAPIVNHALPIFVTGFLFIAFGRVTTSYFYATQKNGYAYVMVYGEPVILAILLGVVLPGMLGLNGVWISIPVTQAILFMTGLCLLQKDNLKMRSSKYKMAADGELRL